MPTSTRQNMLFYGNPRRVRNFHRADVGISPYKHSNDWAHSKYTSGGIPRHPAQKSHSPVRCSASRSGLRRDMFEEDGRCGSGGICAADVKLLGLLLHGDELFAGGAEGFLRFGDGVEKNDVLLTDVLHIV